MCGRADDVTGPERGERRLAAHGTGWGQHGLQARVGGLAGLHLVDEDGYFAEAAGDHSQVQLQISHEAADAQRARQHALAALPDQQDGSRRDDEAVDWLDADAQPLARDIGLGLLT